MGTGRKSGKMEKECKEELNYKEICTYRDKGRRCVGGPMQRRKFEMKRTKEKRGVGTEVSGVDWRWSEWDMTLAQSNSASHFGQCLTEQ